MLCNLQVGHERRELVSIARAQLMCSPAVFEAVLERPEKLVEMRVQVRATEDPQNLPFGLLETRERSRGLPDALVLVDQLRRSRQRSDPRLHGLQVEQVRRPRLDH